MVDPGDELPFVPRHAASATVAFETPRAALAVAGTYVSAMRERAGQGPATTAEPFTDPSFILRRDGARAGDGGRGRSTSTCATCSTTRTSPRGLPFGARPVAPRWVQVGTKWSF